MRARSCSNDAVATACNASGARKCIAGHGIAWAAVPDAPPPDVEGPAGESARPGLLQRLAVDATPLRESKPFRRLWIGQAVSHAGNAITMVAIPFQVYELTHSTLLVGLLALAALIPLLVVPLVGGSVADALDRRRVMIVSELALGAVAGLLLVNALLPHPQIWPLYALEALGTAAWSFARPAMSAVTPRLVRDDQLAAAIALQSIYGNFALVAGPALAGVLISVVGLPAAYGVDFATYGASLAAAWLLPRIRPEGDVDRPGLRSIVDGLRFVRRKPALMGIFLVDTNAMIFGMPSALFPAYGDHFGGGARTVGYLYAAPYVGALGASLLSGWVGHVRRQGLGVCAAAALWGTAIFCFGLAGHLWLALVFLGLAGAADFVSAVLRSTILMQATPDAMRGRMSGIELAQVASAPSLGNLEAGVLASLTSLRFSVVSGGIACIVGTLALMVALPGFVRYDSKNP
jgi:MFS family permease